MEDDFDELREEFHAGGQALNDGAFYLMAG